MAQRLGHVKHEGGVKRDDGDDEMTTGITYYLYTCMSNSLSPAPPLVFLSHHTVTLSVGVLTCDVRETLIIFPRAFVS